MLLNQVTGLMLSLQLLEPIKRSRGFRFQIETYYNDHELSDLFEILERRGAIAKHLGPDQPGWFSLIVPEDNPWIPFLKTVKNCPSVKAVKGLGNKKF